MPPWHADDADHRCYRKSERNLQYRWPACKRRCCRSPRAHGRRPTRSTACTITLGKVLWDMAAAPAAGFRRDRTPCMGAPGRGGSATDGCRAGGHPHCARASVVALIGSAHVRGETSRGSRRTTCNSARSGWASDSTQRLSRSPPTALRLTRVRRINYDHRAWSGAAQGSVAGACARSTGARPRNGHRFGPLSPASTLLQCGARRTVRHPAAAGVKVIHRLIDTGAWVLLSRRKIA